MSVIIKPQVQGEQYTVNGIYVHKQECGWKFSIEPSMKEITAFHFYRKAQIDNPNVKRHTRAVYHG